MEALPSFAPCFFCGTGNRAGLGIRYAVCPDTGQVVGRVTPDHQLCGYPGVLHGGLQAALLDDVMYWAAIHRAGTSGATVELSCSYRHPARLGQTIRLEAESEKEFAGRKIGAQGRLIDPTGRILAEGQALYVLHTEERFRADVLPHFDFSGCTPKMEAHFRGEEPG